MQAAMATPEATPRSAAARWNEAALSPWSPPLVSPSLDGYVPFGAEPAPRRALRPLNGRTNDASGPRKRTPQGSRSQRVDAPPSSAPSNDTPSLAALPHCSPEQNSRFAALRQSAAQSFDPEVHEPMLRELWQRGISGKASVAKGKAPPPIDAMRLLWNTRVRLHKGRRQRGSEDDLDDDSSEEEEEEDAGEEGAAGGVRPVVEATPEKEGSDTLALWFVKSDGGGGGTAHTRAARLYLGLPGRRRQQCDGTAAMRRGRCHQPRKRCPTDTAATVAIAVAVAIAIIRRWWQGWSFN